MGGIFNIAIWWFILLVVSSTVLLKAHSTSKDDRQTCIVYMGDRPNADVSVSTLHTNMLHEVVDSDVEVPKVLYSYKRSFHGFVAKLNKKEMQKMAEMEGVVSVFPNEMKQLHTSRSWDFIGLTPQLQLLSERSAKSDIIIGVIDSGIWPHSESFNDKGFGPPAKKWRGTCAANFTCNNKIIGAKYYKVDGNFSKEDIISPIDTEGHGTHTGSTAAGNLVSSANFEGIATGTARGGVPSARIAVYKVLWAPGASDADILAAFDDAIADGVDIITISIGGEDVTEYFNDPNAIGAFHAMRRGVLVSASAGNDGPTLGTVGSVAPWLLSVAASTTDRKILAEIQLGNKMTYEGVNINSYDLKGHLYPIIHGRDAPNPKSTSLISGSCLDGSLDPKLVKGKIVLCDADADGKHVGFASGAAGIIMEGDILADSGFSYVLPASHVETKDSTSIESYINKTRNPSATIFKSHTDFDRKYALHVASFSSRGPNKVNNDILKPDISAPGVDILAAWTPLNSPSEFKGDKRKVKYNIISGTSMACPHATGAAAYVKSVHPNWSPAAIQSALMTTAIPMSAKLNPHAELAYGAGHINPIKAINPGLIYDAGEIDYIKFLCGQASTQTSAVSRTFKRTVTNVGSPNSTYKAKLSPAPENLEIEVKPSVLKFTSLGQKKSFKLTVFALLENDINSVSLVWDDGKFQVRSPIIVFKME
ncbi:Cucumisin [Quillaja saponaria]|uniref:Cucumisin n=1 Tax=Quillaja saponaria TaxID=32244 RepID=A0AAD7LW67_QUISA|nr:Cucumisin [Quillaja saponaria]